MRSRLLIALMLACLGTAACTSDEVDPATTVAPTIPTTDPAGPTTTINPDALGIEGLEFGDFLDTSYALLARRDPEGLSAAGVASEFGLGNHSLNDLSDSYIRETQMIQAAILDALHDFDRDALTPDEQISFDGYEWYLAHLVDGHRWMYHSWPVHQMVTSYNFNLLLFLSDQHAVATVQDAQDYISRLSQIDRQVGQVIDGLEIRSRLGIVPAREIVDLTVRTLENDLAGAGSIAAVDVTRLRLYTSFAARLAATQLSHTEQLDLLDDARVALEASFVPAWLRLTDYIRSLRPLASDQAGVNRLPDGDEFYRYLLAGETSTDLTPTEIHDLGLEQVSRVQAELRDAFDLLGYPAEDGLARLQARAASEAGTVGGSAAVAVNEALIAEAETLFRPMFDLWPPYPAQVVGDPGGGGYYVSGSVDGTRLGAFYAGTGGASLLTIPTIAYHEAVPGHHTQIAIAQSLDLPFFQRFIIHNAYVEGWALYAERLAYEAGAYDNDPYGNIGRLQLELLRAVRLVVDSGIHHLGWSSGEAREYMNSVVPGWAHEVVRYMAMPAQATGYMVGMQEIIRLRDLVEAEQGESFDLAGFHTLVLGHGSQPLEVLERSVLRYIGEEGS